MKDIEKWLENPNLIKIESKNVDEIAMKYVSYIEDDFDLTAKEIQSYLGCSRQYIEHSVDIKKQLKHIAITRAARNIIRKSNARISDETASLLNKRLLYSRQGFYEYLLQHMYKEVSYQKLEVSKIEEYNKEAYDEILEAIATKNKALKKWKTKYASINITEVLQRASFIQFGRIEKDEEGKKEPGVKVELTDVQEVKKLIEKLRSIKQLQTEGYYEYTANIYRAIEAKFIPKYRFLNLVRYDLYDFISNGEKKQEKIIGVKYVEYIRLPEEEVIRRILSIADFALDQVYRERIIQASMEKLSQIYN